MAMGNQLMALPEIDRTLTDQQWRADIAQAAQSIKEIHFKPFTMVTEPDFDAAIADLEQRVPELTDDAIIISLAQIVARMHDGHTRVHLPRQYPQFALEAELGYSETEPPKFDSLKFHQLPVQFERFEDGVFVIGAILAHQSLIGQKVIRMRQVSIEDAFERANTVSFYENESLRIHRSRGYRCTDG
jgi:hypothetical protein